MDTNKHLIGFVDWTGLKMRIDLSDRSLFPYKREIWWISLGQNIGVESNGKNANFERPVCVLKAFNKYSFLIAPISSKRKVDKYIHEFPNICGEKNYINLSQIKTLSIKRFIRKVSVLPDEDFISIIGKIKNFL